MNDSQFSWANESDLTQTLKRYRYGRLNCWLIVVRPQNGQCLLGKIYFILTLNVRALQPGFELKKSETSVDMVIYAGTESNCQSTVPDGSSHTSPGRWANLWTRRTHKKCYRNNRVSFFEFFYPGYPFPGQPGPSSSGLCHLTALIKRCSATSWRCMCSTVYNIGEAQPHYTQCTPRTVSKINLCLWGSCWIIEINVGTGLNPSGVFFFI